MNLVLTVLQVVAPVFLLACVGFGWVRAGWDYPVTFVTRFAMTLAVPALVFTSLMKAEIAAEALVTMALAAFLGYVVVGLLVVGIGLLSGLDRRTYWGPLIFSTTGNVGLPLAFFAFGETGLTLALVVFAFTSVGQFTLGIWLVSENSAPGRVLKEPMVLATFFGAGFWGLGWQTPIWLTNALELLGQMAIPLMLITLGVAVARLRPGRLVQAFGLSLLKVAICAAAGLGVGVALGLPQVALAVLVVQLITPVAVTSYLLAERHGADADAVAGLVVVSTVLSVAVMPVALALLL